MHRYGVDAVPHLICGGFTKEETENVLIDLNFLDINNVLALRGDARKFDGKFIPEKDGHAYAIDMVKQVADMNKGKYLDPNIENGEKTDFCIGIAGYPEKHFEAPNMDSDLQFAKAKVEAGANYIVTQMFFDNKYYFEFVDKCRAMGKETSRHRVVYSTVQRIKGKRRSLLTLLYDGGCRDDSNDSGRRLLANE